jgi:predicted nucleic acid-binding protein
MKQTFVDTFFILAFTNRDDEAHALALALTAAYKGKPLVVTDGVLLEVGNALARQRRREAAGIIRELLNSPEVEVVRTSEELFDRGLSLYESRPDKQWGLVDCVSFVVMQDRGLTDALTYDQHFVQAGFTALMRKES